MNNHLDSYNNVLNKGNQIYQKKEFQKPNNLFNNCPSFPNKAKDIKQFLNDSMIIENIQNNLNPNRMPFLKKEILDYKNDKNESINENNNNISKLILYEIKKLNKIILKVNDNIKVSTNKIEGKIDGIDSFLRNKREREKIERENEKNKFKNNIYENKNSGKIWIKKEKLYSKNVDDALEQYVHNLNSNENYIKSTVYTDSQSLNLNLNDNDKLNSNTYNINYDLSKYFEIDNESTLLYGCPLNSSITITNDNKIYYPEGNDSKNYIIIGKEEIRFDNNFKYQFQINKKGNRGIVIGFLNIQEAILHQFGSTKCKTCGLLVSSSSKIYNYFFKEQKEIKCNAIKDNTNIIFEYKINNNFIELSINTFKTKINLDFRQIGGNNEFRIALFVTKNCFIQVEKIT